MYNSAIICIRSFIYLQPLTIFKDEMKQPTYTPLSYLLPPGLFRAHSPVWHPRYLFYSKCSTFVTTPISLVQSIISLDFRAGCSICTRYLRALFFSTDEKKTFVK